MTRKLYESLKIKHFKNGRRIVKGLSRARDKKRLSNVTIYTEFDMDIFFIDQTKLIKER